MSNVLFLPAYTHSHPHTHTNRGVHWILTTGNMEFFAICPLPDTAMLNTNFHREGEDIGLFITLVPKVFF